MTGEQFHQRGGVSLLGTSWIEEGGGTRTTPLPQNSNTGYTRAALSLLVITRVALQNLV